MGDTCQVLFLVRGGAPPYIDKSRNILTGNHGGYRVALLLRLLPTAIGVVWPSNCMALYITRVRYDMAWCVHGGGGMRLRLCPHE